MEKVSNKEVYCKMLKIMKKKGKQIRVNSEIFRLKMIALLVGIKVCGLNMIMEKRVQISA